MRPSESQTRTSPGSAPRTRTGPGRNFPGIWLYQRSGLPVRVIATYPNWRKIEDSSGEAITFQADVSEPSAVTRMFEAAEESFGGVAPDLAAAELKRAVTDLGFQLSVAGMASLVASGSPVGASVTERCCAGGVVEEHFAIEDQRFYDHHGFDVRRIGSAALTNLRHGRAVSRPQRAWLGVFAHPVDEGVVVSFNSDSDELARRLNTEAAKAVVAHGFARLGLRAIEAGGDAGQPVAFLSAQLGQPIIVENKSGVGGVLAIVVAALDR